MTRANPGFMLAGKLSATILPCSSRVAIGGSGLRPDTEVWVSLYRSTGGQNVRFTRGLSSKEGEENRDAFNNGGLQLLVQVFPIAVVPALDGLQLLLFVGVNTGRPVVDLDSWLYG